MPYLLRYLTASGSDNSNYELIISVRETYNALADRCLFRFNALIYLDVSGSQNLTTSGVC